MMEDRLNPVDSQYLLIQLLRAMDPEMLSTLSYEISSKITDPALIDFLFSCISFGNEVRKNPAYCATFDHACKTILARQRSSEEKKIRKKDYLEALGWSNGVQLNRIERGAAQMKVENLLTICGGFERESDRRFWKNHLLTFFPGTLALDLTGKTEYEGLTFVLKWLREETCQVVEQTLSEADRVKLHSLRDDSLCSTRQDPLGAPPFRLYKTIGHLVRNTAAMTIQILVEDELQTSLVSWYDWKVKWEKAESVGFAYLPSPRLQRKHPVGRRSRPSFCGRRELVRRLSPRSDRCGCL